MANVLGREKREQVLALGRLGWPLRRIEEATGVRRETASRYLRAAGLAVRSPGRWGHPGAKAAKEVSTDSGAPPVPAPPWPPSPGRSPQASACEPHREWIEEAVRNGRLARAIWQDLVDDRHFRAGYASVRRFVAKLRAAAPREAHPRIETPPGQEAQVDYGVHLLTSSDVHSVSG
jgi:transposase